MTKKKSLVGWAYKDEWKDDFSKVSFSSIGEVNFPFIFSNKNKSYGLVKVRVTIEEIE